MTVGTVAGLVGVVASVLMEYLPGFSTWYQALPNTQQRLFTLGVGAVVVFGSLGLACINLSLPFLPTLAFACTSLGVGEAVGAFIAYLVSNQATYLVLPKSS